MIAILDASAAVEVVVQKGISAKIEAMIGEADSVIAPDLMAAEVANVFWKYHRFENLERPTCEGYLNNALSLVDELVPSSELYAEAFALACQYKHSVYDMLYLVLARRNNGVLLTVDKAFRRLAGKLSIKVAAS